MRLPKDLHGARQGTVQSELVGLVDILPTLIDIAGCPPSAEVDGRSLIPLIQGNRVEWRNYYPGEVKSSRGSQFSLTDGKEKYIYFQWGGREQYFNLVDDPGECHDLSKDPAYADRLKLIRETLIANLSKRNHPATDGSMLLTNDAPYPTARAVRAINPLGWHFDRPNS